MKEQVRRTMGKIGEFVATSEIDPRAAGRQNHLRGLSGLYRLTESRELAREHLTSAAAMYREMGMTCWLEKAEAVLT